MTTVKRRIEALEASTGGADDWPPAPIPLRWYVLDENGARRYVEAGPGELAIMEKARRLVWGDHANNS